MDIGQDVGTTMRRQINGSISQSSMRKVTLAGFRTCFDRFALGTGETLAHSHIYIVIPIAMAFARARIAGVASAATFSLRPIN
jgi:hypothetical protein